MSHTPAPARAFLAALVAVLVLAGPAEAHQLAFDHAPAFVETLGPAEHRGVVITIHGGGWFIVGPEAARAEHPEAALWASRGWTAVNVSYRAGRRSLSDVLWFYDRVRRHVGKRTPICLTGGSAGGHLALMVAVRRPDVACVIARGAPTNLTTIGRQNAWGPDGPQATLPRLTRDWAIEAFGRRGLAAMSPALHADRIRAWVLFAIADRDPFVPWRQALELKRAMPRAHVYRLSWGGRNWVHTSVSSEAARGFRRAERAVARRARRPRRRPGYSSSYSDSDASSLPPAP
jgi:acetyl esterase/lipase